MCCPFGQIRYDDPPAKPTPGTVRRADNRVVSDESTHPDEVTQAQAAATTNRNWAWAAVALGVVFSWIVAGFGSFNLKSTIAVVGAGLGFLVVAFVCPPPRTRPAHALTRRGVAVWTLVLGTFSVQEVINDALGSRHPHPTLSILMDPVLNNHLARAVAIMIWLRFGWVMLHR